MVGMGSSSNSRDPSEVKTSNREIVATFGGALLGLGVLLTGVSLVIAKLPAPDLSSTLPVTEMLSSEKSSRAARDRLKRSKLRQHPWEIERLRRDTIEMLSPDEAAKAARARLARSAEEFETEGIERCEDERSFLLELLTDRQLNEFLEYIEEEYGEEGYKIDDAWFKKGSSSTGYYAETLKKDSCCCGATVEDPCACMIEGVMDCSAVEPKCPCYAAEENCQDCGTTVCDSCGLCDICEGGDINPCCARRTYGMRKGWGAESFSAAERPDQTDPLFDWIVVQDAVEGNPVRKYEETALQRHNFDAFKRQSDLLSEETQKLYEILDTSNSVAESEAIKRAITEVYNAIDILHGGYWDYEAESFSAEEDSEEFKPDKLIPIGTKVRSYDFWPHDKTCYKEGVIGDHARSPSCSPNCMHYHIRTTKVVRSGKSRPVDEGEIFMTHPYADPWDQEYAGQLAPHIQIISTAFPSTSTQ